MFFDACDGIFLNYTWSVLDLQHSTYISGGNRQHDIYVGLDVFGRGCFGGGGYNSYKVCNVNYFHFSIWCKYIKHDKGFSTIALVLGSPFNNEIRVTNLFVMF